MKRNINRILALLLVCLTLLSGVVPAFAEGESDELTDGTYRLSSLASSLGMFKLDEGKALREPTVVVKGDEAWLVVTSGAHRYDRMVLAKYDEVTDTTEGTQGIPVYTENETGYNDGTGNVAGYTFAAPMSKADLETALTGDGQIIYVLRYRADYDNVDNAGKWYKGKSGDYYFTLGELTKISESTDLPQPPLNLTDGTYSLSSLASSLGMFKLDEGKALREPTVVVKGDEAWLVVTSGAHRYDRMVLAKYDEVTDTTEGTQGIPVYTENETGYNDGTGNVAGYTFAAPMSKADLETALSGDGQIFYVVRYRADYETAENAGTWYKAKKGDYYFTLGELTKISDSTELPQPVAPAEEDADYTAVDAALAKIPADLSIYTEDSVQALMDAKNAVVRGLKKSEQDKVDAMAKAIEDAIAALVLKPVDGRVDLEVINTTGMFKGLFAYVLTENGKSTLVVALTGSTYHNLYKGTYAQAVDNGDNRNNWIAGYQNEAGKWVFDIPLTGGETYIPVVSISSTYLAKYEKGENPLERAFYPRQMVLDPDARTLTIGDYDETVTAAVKSEVETFRVADTAEMQVVGGPNSNNFRVAPVLQMLDDTYDQVTYPTVADGKLTTATVALSADKTFAIDMLNAPNLFAFRDKEPVALQLRVKATGETVTVQMTIDMLANTITITGEGPAPASHTYEFTAGGDGTWTKGSKDPMLLTVKATSDDEGTFSRFVGVEVDGKELDKANYEATAGSVNISLKPAYLETLSAGKHTVTVKMTDGSVSTTLTIAKAGPAPDTGDANVALWTALMGVSAAALAVVISEKKRRAVR